MRTTLDLDEKLIKEAKEVSGVKTKRAVIEMGLKEIIAKSKKQNFIEGIGSMKHFELEVNTIRGWRDQETSIIEKGQVNDSSVS